MCKSYTLSGVQRDHPVQSCHVSRRLWVEVGISACGFSVVREKEEEEGSMQHAAADVAHHRRFCCKMAEAYANNGNTERRKEKKETNKQKTEHLC